MAREEHRARLADRLAALRVTLEAVEADPDATPSELATARARVRQVERVIAAEERMEAHRIAFVTAGVPGGAAGSVPPRR